MKTISLLKTDPNDDFYSNVKGALKVYPISEFINWIEINVIPEEDVSIKLNNPSDVTMHFVYNIKDTCTLSTAANTNLTKLKSYQSGIIHEKQGKDVLLKLQKNRDYSICIIQFNKFNSTQGSNSFFLEFEKLFKTSHTSYYFLHTGLPNLQLLEYVHQIMRHPKKELSEKLMVAGYINIVLSIKLDQFLSHTHNTTEIHYLRPSEIKKVQELMDEIHKNPEENYNIDDLCSTTGLSAGKLQRAFKEMHGHTICNYINNVRLLKAEELLKLGDLNVSEIVYSLGWISRSYFCKIFKQKFNCTPRTYQQNFFVKYA